jgi:predicted phosphodiesterase
MDEQFELPVDYKDQQRMLKASLIVTGYTHKFNIDVNGQIIIFEPDEEKNYRAVLNYDEIANGKNIDVEFLKNIAKSIEKLVK